jgi:hypothetical protein
MKRILFLITISTFLLSSCDDIYDNIKDFVEEEKVYPGKYDFAKGKIGFERVEIDLLAAGRILSSEVKLGKAKKTVVEYDDKKVVFDSVCSWVGITGLTQQKLYEFKIYTIDEFGDQSIPVNVSLTPFTSADINVVNIVPPRVISSPWRVQVDWPNGISSVLLRYLTLSYSYTNKNGNVVTGERGENSAFIVENLVPGEQSTINIKYKVIPKVEQVEILDTIELEIPIILNMPTAASYQVKLTNREIQLMEIAPNLKDLIITWKSAGSDYTLHHSTLRYTDNSTNPPQIRDVVIANEDVQTVISGVKSGEAISVISTYEPLGGGGTLVNANPKAYIQNDYLYSREGWTVAGVSDEYAPDGGGSTTVLDNKLNTFWHSNYKPSVVPPPHWIILDMTTPRNISRIDTYRRAGNTATKTVEYYLGVSPDADDPSWTKIAQGAYPTGDLLSLNVSNSIDTRQYRYLKLLTPDSGATGYVCVAEIYLYGTLSGE